MLLNPIGSIFDSVFMIAIEQFRLIAHLGVGANSATGAYVPVGVGAEFAVADNLSIKAEYAYQWDWDNGADSAHVGKIGFNWHF